MKMCGRNYHRPPLKERFVTEALFVCAWPETEVHRVQAISEPMHIFSSQAPFSERCFFMGFLVMKIQLHIQYCMTYTMSR